MGRGLVKIKDRFFEWSTVTDSPVTFAMTEEELRQYVLEEYGRQGLRDLDVRIERCNRTGTSFKHQDLESILLCNRAGPNESNITPKQIYRRYLSEEMYT